MRLLQAAEVHGDARIDAVVLDLRPAQGRESEAVSPKPSKQVQRLLSPDDGYQPFATAVLGGAGAVMGHSFQRRPNEDLSYFLDVYVGEKHIQVYVSPTGRSVRVYVDGTEIK